MRGGFHPLARAQQDLAEIQVSVSIVAQLQGSEGYLVERLLSWLRAIFSSTPHRLTDLDRWEEAWRSVDRNADRSVLELGELATEAADLLAQGTA
jgi:hypothetical protein